MTNRERLVKGSPLRGGLCNHPPASESHIIIDQLKCSHNWCTHLRWKDVRLKTHALYFTRYRNYNQKQSTISDICLAIVQRRSVLSIIDLFTYLTEFDFQTISLPVIISFYSSKHRYLATRQSSDNLIFLISVNWCNCARCVNPLQAPMRCNPQLATIADNVVKIKIQLLKWISIFICSIFFGHLDDSMGFSFTLRLTLHFPYI